MAQLEHGEKVWFDGRWVAWDEANVHLMTHSLHYGLGFFEGIRCYAAKGGRPAVFRLREHVRRLFESAHICLAEIPFTQEELVRACLDVVRANELEDCYIRPLVWMGTGAMGLGAKNPIHVAIAAWRWGAYLGDEGLRRGIRAKVSSFTRMHVNVNMVKGKITGQYVNSILAKREAMLAGYDEAILLDTQGFVAEASGENVFCVKDGVIRTPPAASSPILAGITRDSLMRIASDLGYEVLERTFTRDWMYIADELFCCGTAAELTPVRELDDRRIGSGAPGPITRALQEAYFRAVRGEDERYGGWLSYV